MFFSLFSFVFFRNLATYTLKIKNQKIFPAIKVSEHLHSCPCSCSHEQPLYLQEQFYTLFSLVALSVRDSLRGSCATNFKT